MKRFRPHCAGYIVLYILTLLSLGDVIYVVVGQITGSANQYIATFSMFSYFILFIAVCYTWNYIRAQVCIDGKKMRVAFPANVRPKQGQPRVMFLFRQGDLDMKFIDKTIDLSKVTRYGYAGDLGYDPIDQSQGGEKNKLFPVKEVAIITGENKRYHMNAGHYNPKQRKAIFEQVRHITGVAPEGKLGEELRAES